MLLQVSGVFKDVGLILWSVLLSGAVVTQLQYFGYAIAIVGVTAYSAYKRSAAAAKPPSAAEQSAEARGGEEAQPLAVDSEPEPEAPRKS